MITFGTTMMQKLCAGNLALVQQVNVFLKINI